MESFTITIRNKAGASWPIIVELSGAKTPLPIRREGLLELDLEALWTQVTPRDYGTMLGQALFRDRIREAFLQACLQSQDRLSVQLCVEAPELRTLRWERLCAPLDEQWQFLLLDQRAPLTLALPSPAGRYFPPLGRADLRALVVVASPQGLDRYRLAPFDVAATVASVRTAFGPIPCEVLSTTSDAVGPPTLDALCERLTSTSYTLLHLVCHGRYSTDIGDTVLYLENDAHQVDAVTASRLLDRLSQLRGERGLPHFVFLSTCESASPQAEGALGGLAQRLVRELGVPAVLAMTEPVSLRTAEALSSTFYQRLYAHGHLDLALSEACAGLAERPDSTVAALYSRLGAQPLFEPQMRSSTTSSADQQSRTNLLKVLSKAYREALESSLQGVASIHLSMRERLDRTEDRQPASWQVPQKERLLPEGTTILEVYDEASNGLLILGVPGSGKSTLLYELAQALLTRAAQDENSPVPVVLNLSLWATKRLPLQDWIVEQLELRYAIPRRLGKRWQQDERWLLLLDGLDEVARASRPACVEAINTYLSTRTRLVSLVVCSRLEDYDSLLEPLRLPSVVVVQPLTSEQVDAYLSTAGHALAAVQEVVQRNPVLHELLTTPLMLNVVTLAYRDKATADLPQLGSVQEQQRHIFASYLQRMLPASGKRSPPSSKKMLHSLVWLAQQMRAHSQSLLYLEHLQHDWLPTGWTQQVYNWLGVRLPALLIGGLVSLVVLFLIPAPPGGLMSRFLLGGVMGGLLCSMPAAPSAVQPSRTRPHLLSLLTTAAVLGLFVGLGLVLLNISSTSRLDAPLMGMSFGLGTVLLTLLLARWPPSSPQAISPAVNGARTRRRFWRRLLTNDAVRHSLLVGGLFGLGTALLDASVYHAPELQSAFAGIGFGLAETVLLTLLLSLPLRSFRREVTLALRSIEARRRFWKRVLTSDTSRRGLLIGGLFGLSCGLGLALNGKPSYELLSFALDHGLLSLGLDLGLSQGLGQGLSLALSTGLAWGFCGVAISLLLSHLPTTIAPTEIVVWSWTSLWRSLKKREHTRQTLLLALMIGLSLGLSTGLGAGLNAGLLVGLSNMLLFGGLNYWLRLGLSAWLSTGLSDGLGFGLSVAGSYWLLMGLVQGISSTTFREQQRTIPNQGIHRSGRYGLVLGIVSGSIAAMIGGVGVLVSDVLNNALSNVLSIGLSTYLSFVLNNVLSRGLGIGLAVGLLVTLFLGGLAWWRHWVLRLLLWRSGALPLRLVPLLDEAAQRILLRKVGGGYRFLHDLFRDYLATLDPRLPGGSVTQGAAHHEEAVPSGE